jgi:hypothetical protein
MPESQGVQHHASATSGVGYQVGKFGRLAQTMSTEGGQLAVPAARTRRSARSRGSSANLLSEADQVDLRGTGLALSALRPGYYGALAAGAAERLRGPAACSLTRRLVADPLARSAIAARSPASISSCDSNRENEPVLVTRRLSAAIVSESGVWMMAIPSYCPNIQ